MKTSISGHWFKKLIMAGSWALLLLGLIFSLLVNPVFAHAVSKFDDGSLKIDWGSESIGNEFDDSDDEQEESDELSESEEEGEYEFEGQEDEDLPPNDSQQGFGINLENNQPEIPQAAVSDPAAEAIQTVKEKLSQAGEYLGSWFKKDDDKKPKTIGIEIDLNNKPFGKTPENSEAENVEGSGESTCASDKGHTSNRNSQKWGKKPKKQQQEEQKIVETDPDSLTKSGTETKKKKKTRQFKDTSKTAEQSSIADYLTSLAPKAEGGIGDLNTKEQEQNDSSMYSSVNGKRAGSDVRSWGKRNRNTKTAGDENAKQGTIGSKEIEGDSKEGISTVPNAGRISDWGVPPSKRRNAGTQQNDKGVTSKKSLQPEADSQKFAQEFVQAKTDGEREAVKRKYQLDKTYPAKKPVVTTSDAHFSSEKGRKSSSEVRGFGRRKNNANGTSSKVETVTTQDTVKTDTSTDAIQTTPEADSQKFAQEFAQAKTD
ncbi:hypothetical protein M3P05_19925, partial [Sansalvadorimonas sp. 2012CJ34-2]